MNAIYSAAIGYKYHQLRPFLESIRSTCQDTRVFLLFEATDAALLEQVLNEFQHVEPIVLPRTIHCGAWCTRVLAAASAKTLSRPEPNAVAQIVLEGAMHINVRRYFRLLRVVRQHQGMWENAMISDSRDVILQRDPFREIHGRLITGQEPILIGDCSHNSSWVHAMFGQEGLDRLSARPVACAGVTIGPFTKIAEYLTAMCGAMWARLTRIVDQPVGGWGLDQATHNHLVHDHIVELTLTGNGAGVIATLHYEDITNIEVPRSDGAIEVHGVAPAIVHQYDRHPALIAHVAARL